MKDKVVIVNIIVAVIIVIFIVYFAWEYERPKREAIKSAEIFFQSVQDSMDKYKTISIPVNDGKVLNKVKSIYDNISIIESEEEIKSATIFVHTMENSPLDNVRQFLDVAIKISILCCDEFSESGYEKVNVSFLPNNLTIGVFTIVMEPNGDKYDIVDLLSLITNEEYRLAIDEVLSENYGY